MANIFQLLLAQLYPGKTRTVRTHKDASAGVRQMSAMQDEGTCRASGYKAVRNQDDAASQKRERIQEEVEKEDFLLSQIDEFREKAKQLQELLTSKENKVQELQTIVSEREDKAQELQNILAERQEEADKIVTEFTKKVD